MAVDLAAIRQGLADVIQSETGLRMSAYEPAVPNTPCGWVTTGNPFMSEPHEAFKDGLCEIQLSVRVVGGEAAGIERAQAALDQYMGSGTGQTQSVLDAIYSDTSFGGAISAGNVRVIEVGGVQQVELLGGILMVGFDIPLRIYVPRT